MPACPSPSRRLHLSLAAFGSIAAAVWAQAPQSSLEIPAPTIRVSTHMVLVDVVVTDKQGKPVPGLHPEDFVLEENGKPQKIATFTLPGENTRANTAPLPPGIYSNRSQYRSSGGPATVMLLDALNTPFSDQAYARRQMLRFVQAQHKAGQRMGIFTLTGPLNVLQDFTADPQILYAALQRFTPQQQQFPNSDRPQTSVNTSTAATGGASSITTAAALDASTAPLTDSSGALGPQVAQMVASLQQQLQSFEGAQVAYAEDQRAILTLNALKSITRILGGLPGRKNIIWVTGNLPFSLVPENRTVSDAELGEDLPSLTTRRLGEHAAGNYAATFREAHADEIREVGARMASAQIAVYPVDARGLSISTASDAQETMRDMARETGGRAYVNQNEIKIGIERAFADESAAYTVGYYPENKKWDGKYRQIKVKVKRDGVEVQNRRGYYALDPAQMKGYNPQQDVASALGDVVPATLVAFTARVVPPSANTAVKGKIGVDFLVDASTLSTEDTSGGKRLNFAYFATVYSPQGKMLTEQSKKADQAFDPSTYQQIVQHGILLHLDLDPQPGNNQLRLAVQDGRTGLVGTINAPAP